MARRPHQNTPNRRKFTLPQIRKRLKAHLLELRAIGGGYYLSTGELRARIIALSVAVQETLDRFPTT